MLPMSDRIRPIVENGRSLLPNKGVLTHNAIPIIICLTVC